MKKRVSREKSPVPNNYTSITSSTGNAFHSPEKRAMNSSLQFSGQKYFHYGSKLINQPPTIAPIQVITGWARWAPYWTIGSWQVELGLNKKEKEKEGEKWQRRREWTLKRLHLGVATFLAVNSTCWHEHGGWLTWRHNLTRYLIILVR